MFKLISTKKTYTDPVSAIFKPGIPFGRLYSKGDLCLIHPEMPGSKVFLNSIVLREAILSNIDYLEEVLELSIKDTRKEVKNKKKEEPIEEEIVEETIKEDAVFAEIEETIEEEIVEETIKEVIAEPAEEVVEETIDEPTEESTVEILEVTELKPKKKK